MSSDHYATLGVSPSAERAAIRAAYRALMRRYHPDANPSPRAYKRAQAISVAYSVLKDPAKRARYDEERREADIWRWVRMSPGSVPPPAARNAGIAASMLAILTVGAVLIWSPRPLPAEMQSGDLTANAPEISPAPSRPPADLEPESQRLANISGSSGLARASTEPPPQPVNEILPEPTAPAAKSIGAPAALPAQPPGKLSKPQLVEAKRVPSPSAVAAKTLAESRSTPAAPVVAPKPITETSKAAAAAPPAPPVDAERVASLQRISSGFYDQSLQNADTAKKQELLNVRVRETYQRAACRSNSCVADSYLRQIRDVGAIMQNRAPPSK